MPRSTFYMCGNLYEAKLCMSTCEVPRNTQQSEGMPSFSGSKTEGWDIHNDRKYTLRLLAKDTCNIFGGLSQR